MRGRDQTLNQTLDQTVTVGKVRINGELQQLAGRLTGLTLRALRAADNHKSLKNTYARARTDLLEIGEVLPERWADFLEIPTGKSA